MVCPRLRVCLLVYVCVGAVFHTWIAIVNEPYTKLSKQNRNVIKTIETSKKTFDEYH